MVLYKKNLSLKFLQYSQENIRRPPTLILKRDSTLVFSCVYHKIFKNSYFENHLYMAASGSKNNWWWCNVSRSYLKKIQPRKTVCSKIRRWNNHSTGILNGTEIRRTCWFTFVPTLDANIWPKNQEHLSTFSDIETEALRDHFKALLDLN